MTLVLVIVSFVLDRDRTWAGIRGGAKKLGKILPNYLKLLILIAVVLFFAEGLIVAYLGAENAFLGLLAGMFLGSVTMIPGFIAYPLAGVLVDRGVLYMVVAGFVTTLMMVGVLTYPLEKAYLGARGTLVRNAVSLLVAAIISVVVGLVYGELTGGVL